MIAATIQPHNIDAEAATLGCVLLNRDALLAVSPWLTAEMFYIPKHGIIYEAMLALLYDNTPPDLRTVADALRRRSKLEEIGGVIYLSGLTDGVPSSYHIEHYAREVARCARLRNVIDVAGKIAADAYATDADAGAVEAQAMARVNGLIQQRADTEVEHISLTVEQTIADMSSDEAPAISTGFSDLDHMIGGLYPSDFLIVAARPAMGKTAFALSLIDAVARDNAAALIFSLEMDRKQLVQRLAAMACGIDVQLLRRRMVPREKQAEFAATLRRLAALPIFISDYSGVTPSALRAMTMRHVAEYPRSLIVVDYLQLMGDVDDRQNGKRYDNRQQEVSDISRSLKRLARDAHVPVLALAQLNRGVEARASKIPMLSDLRESGSLEQDADIVSFIYRDEVYEPNTDKKGIAELHIAKHRNGPIGVVPFRFDAATTRFSTLTYRTLEGY